MIAKMSENKQTPDSELLLQIVGYNSEAFEQLYNRYSATVYSLIKEIITNPKLAEKILLNVFSVFLKRIEYYSTTSNDIFTWLTLLARNISIDNLKRMKCVEDIPLYSDEYEVKNILPNLSKVITAISLDDRAAMGEKIKFCKSQLTEVQNLVLSLIYFEGLDEMEIAKRLSIPSVTLRQKIINIMESLHSKYTGKTEDVNGSKKVLTLVKLESLGCLSQEEKALLNELRANDPDFLWKELGEYQNLTAILSTSIPLEHPRNEIISEVKEIFAKISGGEAVENPAIVPDPSYIRQPHEIIEKSVQQTSRETIPSPNQIFAKENIKQPEKVEIKKPEFQLKFREPDPKELHLLKKTQTTDIKTQPVTVSPKTESEINLTNKIVPENKLDNAGTKTEPTVGIKEVIKPVAPETKTIQNKVSSIEVKKPDNQLKSNNNSVFAKESRPFVNSEPPQVKNHLIPNSSINLKEFLKNEQKPITNKEAASLKSSDTTKRNIFVDKLEKILEKKLITPTVDKSVVEAKISEQPKEALKTTTPIQKDDVKTEEKSTDNIESKTDIRIKSNEPPKEFGRANVFTLKDQKIAADKTENPIVTKSEEEKKQNIQAIEKINSSENKIPSVIKQENVPEVNKEKLSPAEKPVTKEIKEENLPNHIKSVSDKSNLRIRETVFSENEQKSEHEKSEIHKNVNSSKTDIEADVKKDTLKEAINVDDILSRIDDEKTKTSTLSETESYEKQIVALRKKLRRNILISAAMFMILAATSIFIYLSFQKEPEKVVDKGTKSESVNLAGQTDLAINNDITQTTESETENAAENKETVLFEETVVQVKEKVVAPPLPEITTKEESTLFAANINTGLTENNEKEPIQIAAAKTETLIPPKENKVVEEEPAFFVAVEEMPELIGGIQGLQSRITYPKIAEQTGTQGKVIVQAVVDENGNVISANTIKSIGAGCDEVALDAVLNSKFKPGKQRGKNVKVQVTIPIMFKK
jgi:protein TonB